MAKRWSATSLVVLALLGCLVWTETEAQMSKGSPPPQPQVRPVPKDPIYPQPQVRPAPKDPIYPQPPQVRPVPKDPIYPQPPQVRPVPKDPIYPQPPQVRPVPKDPIYPQPQVRPVPKDPIYPQPQVRPVPKDPIYPQPQVRPVPKDPIYPQPPQVRPVPKDPIYPQPPQVRPVPKDPIYPQPPQVRPVPKDPIYPQPPQVRPVPKDPIHPQPPQIRPIDPPIYKDQNPIYPQQPQIRPVHPLKNKDPIYPPPPQVRPMPKDPVYPPPPQVRPVPKDPIYPQPQVRPVPKDPIYPQPQVRPVPKDPIYPQPQVRPVPKDPIYPQPQVRPVPKDPIYPQPPPIRPVHPPTYPQPPQVRPVPRDPIHPQPPPIRPVHPPTYPQGPQVSPVPRDPIHPQPPPIRPVHPPTYPQGPQVSPVHPERDPKDPQIFYDQEQQVPKRQHPRVPQIPKQAEPIQSCEVAPSVRIPCGRPEISAAGCEAINCCFDGRQCYFGKAVTVQCTVDAQFILVVARDATLPNIDLESISLFDGGQQCTHADSNSQFVVYQFPVTGCGSVVMEEPGVIIYENRMSSSYEVGVGPLGAITRDSHFELLFQCRYTGTSVETVVVEVLPLQEPPLPVAGLGPLRVALRLANGQCFTKGCNEVDVAFSSYYTEADYPVTKVLRDPVYVEVQLLEKMDPMLVLTLGRCWTTISPNPHSLPQWDILINGCPYRDDRYMSSLVPVDLSSGLEFPSHYRRFLFKMFTFVEPSSLTPMREQVYIHCSTAVCSAAPGRTCEPSCHTKSRKRRDDETVDQKREEPKIVVSVGPVIIGAPEEA